jgi:membrane-associated PAP2 superfamily phosphatase
MFFGIAVVVIGVVFLLQNLGFISSNVWSIIWPVLIILFGFSIIFKKGNCCGWGSWDKPER